MAKIKIEEIRTTLEELGWKVISEKYENLETEMQFECNEGHIIYAPWKKLRNKIECPICKANVYKSVETKVVPKKKGEKRILALDQATKVTGYSIYDGTQLVKYGVHSTSQELQEDKFSDVRGWLINMINVWQPEFVGFEGIQLQDNLSGGQKMGVTTFEALARLQGVIMVTCKEMGIPFEIYPTNTWRQACGVKGRARAEKKRSMQKLAKEWFDITVTEDEADAIGIGKHTATKFNTTHKVFNWET